MAPKEHKEQITSFHHQDDAWKIVTASDMDPTFNYGYHGDADLGEFLGRPTKIHEQSWTVAAGSFDQTINPWKLFVEDTRVRSRIEGYKLMQGKLHLRITINGNPFLYGRAMASYFPRGPQDEFFQPTDATLITMQESMRPHIFIDPTSSSGGEMVLPFFCPDNWIELSGKTADYMGTLRVFSINNLLHANAASGSAQITVFAWLEDVKLASPTESTYATYDAQAGGDEYGQGIVSKPASTVAKIAGYLEEAPIIGLYAKATSLVATGIGRVASIFGYSRPNIVSDIVRHKPFSVGVLANTDAHEAVTKLSLDSKQELCVDPRTTGLSNVDEMNMKYIAQRECYLGTTTWTEAQADGTLLRSMNVTPVMHNVVTGTPNQILLSPMCTVSVPFRYWRGSIKYRIQIVASQMHRGRIRLHYDPTFGSNVPAYNENYSRVVDLATNRDFEFVVGWNSHTSWLQTDLEALNPASLIVNHDETSANLLYHNGQVRLTVLNQLTSPDPSLGQAVYINIYASACDDFELAAPHDEIMNKMVYLAQSGPSTKEDLPEYPFFRAAEDDCESELEQFLSSDESIIQTVWLMSLLFQLSLSEYPSESSQGYKTFLCQAGNENEELVADVDDQPEGAVDAIDNIGEKQLMDATTHVYMGEDFCSIRALLKRYCFHSGYGSQSAGYWMREYNFPYYGGPYTSFNRHDDASGIPVPTNFGAMTFLNWFTPCYAGWRGGLRSKYVASGSNGTLVVRRDRPRTSGTIGVTGFSLTTGDESFIADELLQLNRTCGGGAHMTVNGIDGANEVEFPFYSNKRFAHGRMLPIGTATNLGQGHVDTHVVVSRGQSAGLSRYVAAGDDYSLFFFIGQPILSWESPLASGTTESLPEI